MGAVYLFGEALSAAQILAIYQLGPGYQVGKEQSLRQLCSTVVTFSQFTQAV